MGYVSFLVVYVVQVLWVCWGKIGVVVGNCQIVVRDCWYVVGDQIVDKLFGVVGYGLVKCVVVGVELQIFICCVVDYWCVVWCYWLQVCLESCLFYVVVVWEQIVYYYFQGFVMLLQQCFVKIDDFCYVVDLNVLIEVGDGDFVSFIKDS